MPGVLYLVATPIGNLGDITLRALSTLRAADLIAAEDTRKSRALLNHFEIRKPLVSYFEHNKQLREGLLLDKLLAGGNVALICDAGTPGLSDPGADIARAALARGIEVVAIPGASALLTALTSCGLDNGPFCFEGFLPREKAARRNRLAKLTGERRTMIFYEAPHRLRAALEDLAAAFGGERQAAACRELTKLYEEKLRGSLDELRAHFALTEPRGEFTLVVAGAADQAAEVDADAAEAEFMALLAEGVPRKTASRLTAEKYGLKTKDIYGIGLKKETE